LNIVLEVSSHGIHQKTEGLQFVGAFYQFISRSFGLSSHFAEYRDVKKSFFDNLQKTAFTLSNIDDKMARGCKIQWQNALML
jgi:UDP-N-acetylmuramoyl-L-alanyl-D-glutamate--2,6-diaminopimelate ligase